MGSQMVFTGLGLVSAMLFGALFGSEGELPPQVQDLVFFGSIVAGAGQHG